MSDHSYIDHPQVPPGWKQLASGKGINIGEPDPAAVDFNSIAVALSMLCRFTGAVADVTKFYSVAQHSCLVHDLMRPDLRMYGLLHDAHEALFGDDSTPKKRLMETVVPQAAEWLGWLKDEWDRAIFHAAGLPEPNEEIRAAIKACDHLAMAIERRDLLAEPADDTTRAAWSWLPDPQQLHVQPLRPEAAYAAFMARMAGELWHNYGEAGRA